MVNAVPASLTLRMMPRTEWLMHVRHTHTAITLAASILWRLQGFPQSHYLTVVDAIYDLHILTATQVVDGSLGSEPPQFGFVIARQLFESVFC